MSGPVRSTEETASFPLTRRAGTYAARIFDGMLLWRRSLNNATGTLLERDRC